jgi:hypothetical protein
VQKFSKNEKKNSRNNSDQMFRETAPIDFSYSEFISTTCLSARSIEGFNESVACDLVPKSKTSRLIDQLAKIYCFLHDPQMQINGIDENISQFTAFDRNLPTRVKVDTTKFSTSF